MEKSLQEEYLEFCEEYKADINKERSAKGLPSMSKLLSLTLPAPLSFEEYVEIQYMPYAKYAAMSIPFLAAQKAKSKLSRGKVSAGGQTIKEIVEMLALSHGLMSAKELWTEFWAKLDALGLDPEESDSTHTIGDIRKLKYTYDFQGGRKSITFGRFATIVSKFRATDSFKQLKTNLWGENPYIRTGRE